MLSALTSIIPGRDTPPLVDDLRSVGIDVLGDFDCTRIVQEAIRTAPDLVICSTDCPDRTLFAILATLTVTAPRPVVLFTSDPDAEKAEQALASGVSAYVVGGYGVGRLRSVIHLAMSRFARERALATQLSDLQQRFAERTLVDRAKGIIMGARQIREDEAYRALRTGAMQAKQRIGQMARMVIESARYGEAINRAGQFRMLSQRLVKFYALGCAKITPVQTRAAIGASIDLTELNLAALQKNLSEATFGDLIDAVATAWPALKAALTAAPAVSRLEEVNRLADELLARAERLTNNLEIAGMGMALHVINVSGRQRMLAQRLAKDALLAAMLAGPTSRHCRAAMAGTRTEFIDAMAYLAQVPLTTAAIQGELQAAARAWAQFDAALDHAEDRTGWQEIGQLSETLLSLYNSLTDRYEKSMQELRQS